MYHLDNGSGVDAMPTVANKQSSFVKWFTEGDNKNSPSYPGQDWFNITQAELLNILTAAKITPDKTKLNQVTLAIQQLAKGAIPSASTTVAGIVQLDSSTNSTAENKATTPKAVKAAYDLADTANTTSHKKNQNISINKSTPQLNLHNADKRGVSIKLKDDNEFEILYLKDSKWSVKARYIESSNTFQFLNLDGFTINGKKAIKQGDYGVGSYGANFSDSNFDNIGQDGSGFYNLGALSKGTYPAGFSYFSSIIHMTRGDTTDNKGSQIIIDTDSNRAALRTANISSYKNWVEFITTANILNYMPIGIPQPWPTTTPPSGWLKCNGATFDKTLYPKLAIAYPGGKLPDLRGEFIRGYDDGRGIDSSRTILSNQGDAIRNITGSFRANGRSWDADKEGGVFYRMISSVQGNGSSGDGCQVGFDASRVVPVANENRPRNIAFLYIVKAE